MYNLKIQPNEYPIKIEIHYYGLLTASYVYSLWEKDSNDVLESKQGNNLNSQDDIYYLQMPNTANIGRFLELFSTLNNPETDQMPEQVALKIIQDSNLLFTEEEPDGTSSHGTIFTIVESISVPASSTILNDIFIRLI